jgi:formylglycine-generating enzyme required for sulfatase activity
MTNRPLRVFLCHSSNDKPAVRELYQKLRAEPWIQPWLDEEELYPGQDWNMEIEKAVEAADAIIVCLTKSSITKEGYIQKEIKTALDFADYKPEGTVFIIPVRLEECIPPKRLGRWQYADYFEGQRERALKRLLVSLKKRADSIGALSILNASTDTLSPDDKKTEISGSNFNFGEIRTDNPEVVERMFSSLTDYQKLITGKRKNKTSKVYTLSNGMEFMRVTAGKFLMGSDDGEGEGDFDFIPKHVVEIPYVYWMGRFPVTNEMYNYYVRFKGFEHPVDNWEKKRNHPVVNVDWKDVLSYCEWLNATLGDEIQDGLVLRLPTEAEWEKAARGTDGFNYPWGNEFDKNKCNSEEGGIGNTTPVDLYSPRDASPYGCSDMSGNVLEWTHSLAMDYPYQLDNDREDESAPFVRVVRGGVFDDNESVARCVSRSLANLGDKYASLGFRIVLAPSINSLIQSK